MDPISDLLTRIRNSNVRQHDRLDVPMSKMKLEVVRVLKDEGFIANYKSLYNGTNKRGTIRVFLKYSPTKECVIRGIKRVSKPGLRVYRSYSEIPRVRGGFAARIGFRCRLQELPERNAELLSGFDRAFDRT